MILVAAAIGVIAMFLPWWSISLGIFGGGSVNGMHGEGIIVFLCFIGAVILALMGDQSKNLTQSHWMLALIAGGLAAIITLITFFNIPEVGDRGIGLYLALLAAIAMVAFAFLFRSASDSLQSGFDSLKSSFTNDANTTSTGATTTTTPTTTVSHTPTDDTTRPTL